MVSWRCLSAVLILMAEHQHDWTGHGGTLVRLNLYLFRWEALSVSLSVVRVTA